LPAGYDAGGHADPPANYYQVKELNFFAAVIFSRAARAAAARNDEIEMQKIVPKWEFKMVRW
jgi:hypothetical protein